EPPEREPGPPWYPRPEPSGATLIGDAVVDAAGAPLDLARAAVGAIGDPRQAGASAAKTLAGLASMAAAGIAGAPPSPLNTKIGPHRRYAWVETELDRFKAIKSALGGTV